ncbi:ABC transporter permease [Schaalia sp. 19OD2882]|uniref:ABC transporter permease n=1 Tax=Schaalia sp. 19OD2882 TaxID=2794089 RepID=UPI001C1E9844|nr:ABC transporter permease [Schaalia sp. 19OD2882]QWW19754.1 ABC transporter permease [Schaalia sp. 19OD2882]
MNAMILKEFRELRRDRRTLAILVFMPFMLLLVFGYAANFTVESTSVLVTGPAANSLAEELKDNQAARDDLVITTTEADLEESAIEGLMRSGQYVAVVRAEKSDTSTPIAARTHLWVDGSQLFAAQAATASWMQVLSQDVQTRIEDLRAQAEQARATAEDARAHLDEVRAEAPRVREQLERLQSSAAQFRSLAQTLQVLRSDPTALARGTVPLPDPQALANLPDPTQIVDLMASGKLLELTDLPELPEFPDTSALDISSLDTDQMVTTVFNPDLKTSWVMIPALIGLILAFIGIIVTAIGLTREREAGTMEQLAVMPLSPGAIIGGKVAPYLLLALLDAGIITVAAVWIFGVPFRGSLLLFSLLSFIFLFVVLGMGILISSISQNTGQAIQVAMMTVMPQTLLSGFVFPLESMAEWVRWIGYCLPLTWFAKASTAIMLKGAGPAEVAMPLGILCVMAFVVFGAAIIRMTRSLRRGGATQ